MTRAAGCVLGALALFASVVNAAALERVPAALHVHSQLSTGDFSIDELAAASRREGVAALLIVENYLLRVEYGLPPFRALTRFVREERSVKAVGVERYLQTVAGARTRHPGVLILPGVEVMPHYRWTGSPLALDMMLSDTQKNLLVFGVEDAEALKRLPVIGNREPRHYSWQSVLDALPVLLVVPGAVLLVSRRVQRRRLGRKVVVTSHRSRMVGVILVGLAAVAFARAWPFTVDRYPPWEDFGLAPYQALIDHVERIGGMAIWSFSEAPDAGEQRMGPVRVTWRTEPYPDDLLRTFRYTAFGGLYEQHTRFVEIGGGWDRMLGQFVAGERTRPAWAVGEAGFHGPTAGKRLGVVQTVFLVEERTERAMLDALRRGRLYALYRTAEFALGLSEFSIGSEGAVAVSGDTLRARGEAPVEVRIAVDAADETPYPVRVTLIRNGAPVAAWVGQTPFRAVHREVFDGRPSSFRVEARGTPPHRLLTSPIFVTVPP